LRRPAERLPRELPARVGLGSDPAVRPAGVRAADTARFEKTTRHARRIVAADRTRETGGNMIKLSTTQLWVHDQDEALRFWTEKVGFEVRQDVTMAELGNFRWLT